MHKCKVRVVAVKELLTPPLGPRAGLKEGAWDAMYKKNSPPARAYQSIARRLSVLIVEIHYPVCTVEHSEHPTRSKQPGRYEHNGTISQTLPISEHTNAS